MRRSEYQSLYPQEHFIVPLLRNRIAALLDRAELKEVKRVLDVGAGGQPLRTNIEHRGWQYFSTDHEVQPGLSTDFIQAIDKPLQAEISTVEPFDLVLLTEVMEHVADWPAAFANLSLLCKPGAYLLMTAPFIYQPHEVPHDYWRPTGFAIEAYAKRYGFEVVSFEQAGGGWEVLGTVLANLTLYSNARTLINRLYYRLLSLGLKKLLSVLQSGKIYQLAGVHSPLYLSNIALLKRLNG
jgi:SAM-dependent methyltransferase